jgi:Rrf2 family protein
MNVPRYDDIALLLMMELSIHYGKGTLSLSDIARQHGLSVLFLKKIARTLVASNLVTSKEGKNGGYSLSKPPTDINLWQVLGSFSPQVVRDAKLPSVERTCPIYKDCLPQQVHHIIDRTLASGFSSITLADALRKETAL